MTQAKSFDYQAKQAELETLLAALQSGELDIDEAIATYERGMQLASELGTYLKTAEHKIAKVKKTFEA